VSKSPRSLARKRTFFVALASELVRLIETETELNTPDAAGQTIRQQLEFNAAKAAALGWAKDARLDPFEFSVPHRFHLYASTLLYLYSSMSAGRQVSESGVQAHTWSDMLAWTELNEYVLDPYEIDTLKAMDVAYVRTFNRLKAERSR